MADSQVLLVVGLLLVLVAALGEACKLFGAELGALRGRQRLVALVLGGALLAAWMWLPLPGSRQAARDRAVADYRARVSGTCADIRGTDLGSAAVMRPGGYDRDAMARLLRRQHRVYSRTWSAVWQVDPPENLRQARDRARTDMDAFLATVPALARRIQRSPTPTLTFGRFTDLADDTGLIDRGTVAQSSLSALAGRSCSLDRPASS